MEPMNGSGAFRRGIVALAAVALVLAAESYGLIKDEQSRRRLVWAAHVTHGESSRGPAAFRTRGCGRCHELSAVPEARGTAGPPLGSLGSRAALARGVPEKPEALVRWLRDPRHAGAGVTEREARDIAALLYALP